MRIDYPRAGRTGVRHWLPSWRQLLSAGGPRRRSVSWRSFVVLVWRTEVPEPNDVATAQTSIVYWSDGTTELGRLGEANRINVPLEDVPLDVQHAVLAAEDRDFYDHGGFSPHRHRSRDLEQPLRRRPAGRIDDHAAVREERVPDPGALVLAQGAGAAARGEARDRRVEGPDPQRLPQHHLLRPRRLRHRGRLAAVLREVRRATSISVRPRRSPRSSARRATTTRPTPTTSRGSRVAGTTRSTAWSARAGSRRRRRPTPRSRSSRRPSPPTVSAGRPAICSTRSVARWLIRASPRTTSTAAAIASCRPSTARRSARRSRRSRPRRRPRAPRACASGWSR